MNRKRALYRYEFGRVKWFLALAMLGCILVLLFANSQYATRSELWYMAVDSFNSQLILILEYITTVAIFAVAVMVLYQFSDYHTRTRREYISSLPYTQRERFVVKYVVGIGTITAVCIVLGLGIWMIREQYFPQIMKSYFTTDYYKVLWGNDSGLQTFRCILLFWVSMLTVYTIFTLIHSLITKGIVAGIVGLGAVFTPMVVLNEIIFFAFRFGNPAFANNGIVKQLRQAFCALSGSGYCQELYESNGVSTTAFSSFINYGSMFTVFSVLILILVICFGLAYRVNVKQDGAKYGVLVVAKWAQRTLSAGLAVTFSYFFSRLVDSTLYNQTMAGSSRGIWAMVVVLVTMVPIYLLGMVVSRRVME